MYQSALLTNVNARESINQETMQRLPKVMRSLSSLTMTFCAQKFLVYQNNPNVNLLLEIVALKPKKLIIIV